MAPPTNLAKENTKILRLSLSVFYLVCLLFSLELLCTTAAEAHSLSREIETEQSASGSKPKLNSEPKDNSQTVELSRDPSSKPSHHLIGQFVGAVVATLAFTYYNPSNWSYLNGMIIGESIGDTIAHWHSFGSKSSMPADTALNHLIEDLLRRPDQAIILYGSASGVAWAANLMSYNLSFIQHYAITAAGFIAGYMAGTILNEHGFWRVD